MSFPLAPLLSKNSLLYLELALGAVLLAAGHVRDFVLYQLEQVLGHRRDLPPLDADLALPVLRDYKVDRPELVVGTVVVEPPLGPRRSLRSARSSG
jgi:hypothetical protein